MRRATATALRPEPAAVSHAWPWGGTWPDPCCQVQPRSCQCPIARVEPLETGGSVISVPPLPSLAVLSCRPCIVAEQRQLRGVAGAVGHRQGAAADARGRVLQRLQGEEGDVREIDLLVPHRPGPRRCR